MAEYQAGWKLRIAQRVGGEYNNIYRRKDCHNSIRLSLNPIPSPHNGARCYQGTSQGSRVFYDIGTNFIEGGCLNYSNVKVSYGLDLLIHSLGILSLAERTVTRTLFLPSTSLNCCNLT